MDILVSLYNRLFFITIRNSLSKSPLYSEIGALFLSDLLILDLFTYIDITNDGIGLLF